MTLEWYELAFLCFISGVCGGLVVWIPLNAKINSVADNSEPKRRRYG